MYKLEFTALSNALADWPWLSATVAPAYEFIAAKLNSQFGSALVGALAGAWFGAKAAHRTSSESTKQTDLLSQIANLNAATSLAAAVVSGAITPLRQHVRSMLTEFNKTKSEVERDIEARRIGVRQGNMPLKVTMDLKIITPPVLPIHTLQELMFGKLLIGPKALALAVQIGTSYSNIQQVCDRRSEVIERFREAKYTGNERVYHYLGIALQEGVIDQEYADLLDSLHGYLEDLAFFAHKLCQETQSYARLANLEFRSAFGRDAPGVVKADFEQQRSDGYIPSDERYKGWLSAFPPPKPPVGRFGRWQQRLVGLRRFLPFVRLAGSGKD